MAALTVAVVTVPQALAYAVIAGVPPAMGLYAATVPTVVGSLFRSSRHVISDGINLLTARSGPLWARRFDAEAIVDDEGMAERVGYTVANPQNANLVESSDQWP